MSSSSTAPLHPDPRAMNQLDHVQLKKMIEESAKQLRDLKSQELRANADIAREERVEVGKAQKESDLELLRWRREAAEDARAYAEQKSKEERQAIHEETKQHDEFKRQVRLASAKEESERVQDNYATAKEQALFNDALVEATKQEKKKIVEQHLETVEHVRDHKRQLKKEQADTSAQDRLIQDFNLLNAMQKELEQQKAEVARRLQMARTRKGVAVKTGFAIS